MRFAPSILALAAALGHAASAGAVQPNFKVYDDQFAFTPRQRLTAGLRLDLVPLSTLTTTGAASASALEAQTTWDFTPSASLLGAHDTIAQALPVTSQWTCYLPDDIGCGFGA